MSSGGSKDKSPHRAQTKPFNFKISSPVNLLIASLTSIYHMSHDSIVTRTERRREGLWRHVVAREWGYQRRDNDGIGDEIQSIEPPIIGRASHSTG